MKQNRADAVSNDEIVHAASCLRSGKLVAFPTETVYGLGADALDAVAVARIFEVKGRPNTSPVIVHVSDHEMVATVAASWPDKAQILAENFWPGPLTLVLPKTPAVPDIVTAGLPTVGVRMPAHPIALALIAAAQVPIAAPSANRFGQVSPTTAEHVRQGLGDRVDFILDGGPCTVGIESTVLSLVEDVPVLLRPGGISRQQIEAVIGEIASARTRDCRGTILRRECIPATTVRALRCSLCVTGMCQRRDPEPISNSAGQPHETVSEVIVMPNTAAEYAARLYSVLHAIDARGYDWIAVETPGPGAEWEAVLDRLRRAASSL